MAHETREQWFAALTSLLRAEFEAQGFPLPERIRSSCGFPGGGSKFKRIGEHWAPTASSDDTHEIFISPVLDSLISVFGTQVHELCHAATPGAKHGARFKKCGTAMGLVGKPTSMGANTETMARYQHILNAVGPYPHAKMNLNQRTKQTTRLVKCECKDCGYIVRTTSKWLGEKGAPLCPCNTEPMEFQE